MRLQINRNHLRLAAGSLWLTVLASKALGTAQRARHPRTAQPPPDDARLAHKVETELFRLADAPKATMKVKAVDGVIFLGGVAQTRGQMLKLERRAQAIPDVKDVVNLLHLPRAPSEGAQVQAAVSSSHAPR